MKSKLYPGLLEHDKDGCIKLGQMIEFETYIGTIVNHPSEDTPIIKVFCFDGLYRNFTHESFNNTIKYYVKFIY